MHKKLTENPKTAITIIVSFITALSGAGYNIYNTSNTFIDSVATKSYVDSQISELSIEIVNAKINTLEGELMRIAFLEETGKVLAVDRLLEKKYNQNLIFLRTRRAELIESHSKIK